MPPVSQRKPLPPVWGSPPAWVITIVILLLTNTLSGVWWASAISERAVATDRRLLVVETTMARRISWESDIARLQATVSSNGATLQRIDAHLTGLERERP